MEKLIKEVTPYEHPDAPAKLNGKGINLMISPLPRNKRAKNPRQDDGNGELRLVDRERFQPATAQKQQQRPASVPTNAAENNSGFGQTPFADLDVKLDEAS